MARAKTSKKKETFELAAPGASSVMLAANFTGWQSEPIPMKKNRQGTWKTTVTLEPGVYEYRFMVDGQWCDDPSADSRVTNPYGTANAVREVPVT